MIIKLGERSIKVDAKKTNPLTKFLGLMFRSKNTSNLLFEFKSFPTIHSYFVFFSFLAIWLDDRNNVRDFSIVRPFTFMTRPKKSAVKLVEIPINKKNQKILHFFLDKQKI